MNIYVGNLSYDITEEELRNEFATFGRISSVSIPKDKYSGQAKGFAFVEMPVLSEGQAAIKGLNGKMLKDRKLTVNGARERSGARSGGGSYGGRGGSGRRDGGFGGGGRQRRY
ncbi:MAG: RNA-binding protein [Chloroflexi bacterium]|nr:RNA-binding protein [Chloroflexota bacterium]MBM3176208.1 RNA-binding protein [Chloroflexota bacterium]MBM4450746.1 RNA-binding protein [Chloroflexota bacterium]